MRDDFWTHDIFLFSGTFQRYRNERRPVRGKIHTSQETYRLDAFEQNIRPIPTLRGSRTYVMLHPYVLEPILTFSVGLYNKPKQYADQGEAIGETIGNPKQEGIREIQIGSGQVWYYHEDKIIEIWECFLWEDFRTHPFVADPHMQKLWLSFEQWLSGQFPEATKVVTPSNDPIAKTIEEYQTFLRSLGFDRIAKSAFGKPVAAGKLPAEAGQWYDSISLTRRRWFSALARGSFRRTPLARFRHPPRVLIQKPDGSLRPGTGGYPEVKAT